MTRTTAPVVYFTECESCYVALECGTDHSVTLSPGQDLHRASLVPARWEARRELGTGYAVIDVECPWCGAVTTDGLE